ncbi:hypothetical protein TNCV_3756331 [Trichonephila clavipes]|nr:hypothetical protein TNCV_3756331 [Trichonephila clavipes]
MVLKANDRRTSCPYHDEFRGPRSDYVRQVLAASTALFFQFQRYAATLCQFLIFRVFKSFLTSSTHLVGGLPLVRDPIGFLNV